MPLDEYNNHVHDINAKMIWQLFSRIGKGLCIANQMQPEQQPTTNTSASAANADALQRGQWES